jgi:hypothetical protein
MSNLDPLLVILIGCLFGVLIIVIPIIAIVLRNINWTNSKKLLSRINTSDFEIFENVKIQLDSFSNFRVYSHPSIKATILINSSQIIIIHTNKPKFGEINLNLPIEIRNSGNKEDYDIRIFKWRKIVFILKPSSKEFIKIRQEINISPKDRDSFERLQTILQNWR